MGYSPKEIEEIEEIKEMTKEKAMLSKNFSLAEFECSCGCGETTINMTLVDKLQELRDTVGRPLVITSGYRCPQYNATVGGAPDSEHTYGEAVDIAIAHGFEMYEILNAAFACGFKRIGYALNKGFVHLGVSDIKPQEITWGYC